MSDEPKSVFANCRDLAAGQGVPNRVRLYTVLFTVAVTAFFGLLVSGANVALKPYRAKNEKAARLRVLLSLLELLPEGKALSAAELADRFEAGVETVDAGSADKPYTYYRRKDDPARVAIPLGGRGFWGPIEGYMALDTASKTIRAIEFTGHDETPGLGGRISEPDFRGRFRGVPYGKPEGRAARIRVRQDPNPDNPREIDAITGATATSDAIERIVNDALERFENRKKHSNPNPRRTESP